jgi:hypothetical protein
MPHGKEYACYLESRIARKAESEGVEMADAALAVLGGRAGIVLARQNSLLRLTSGRLRKLRN